MSLHHQRKRGSRSSPTSNQPRRRHEHTTQSDLIFVQNKVPADFAIPKLGTLSSPETTALEEQRPRRPSSNDERQIRRSRTTRMGSREFSVPEAIPSSSLLEHIATDRFFHHYVSPTRTFFRLDLDFTHSVIDGASKRAILAEAIIAMGILTLPNKDRAAYTAARLRHSRALRLTNLALRDSQFAKSDEMLMAVLLLGLYETTPDATHSILSWTSHLDGARYLLRIRGKTFLETGAAYRMFSILRVQIMLNCFMSMQRVPQDLVTLSTLISESQTTGERTASELMHLFARMCNLAASARESAIPDVSRIITDASALENELTNWAANAPDDLQISVQTATPTTKAYSDTFEVYSSTFSAEVWIIYRTARFGVNSLLASLYSAMLANDPRRSHSPQAEKSPQGADSIGGVEILLQECTNILEAIKVDMSSAIPFLLDLHETQQRALANLPLSNRTPAINLLMFLTRVPGTGEKMYSWAEDLIVELQAEEDVDKGAIWMNNPSVEHYKAPHYVRCNHATVHGSSLRSSHALNISSTLSIGHLHSLAQTRGRIWN